MRKLSNWIWLPALLACLAVTTPTAAQAAGGRQAMQHCATRLLSGLARQRASEDQIGSAVLTRCDGPLRAALVRERMVEHFAARPQVQERLTKQVAECLATRLRAPGVGVVLEAEHSCMTLRGVRAHGAKTVTSALLGTLRTDPASRAEFFALAGVPH